MIHNDLNYVQFLGDLSTFSEDQIELDCFF